MTARLAVALSCLLVAGCGCFSWPPWRRPPAPVVVVPAPDPPAPVKPAAPEPAPPVQQVEAPKLPPQAPSRLPRAPSAALEPADNGDRAKRITAARGDLKTGLTQLELRAVTACVEPGEACVENDALMTRARALDKQLAAALLDPQLAVNWAEVTTVLRAVVDTAMKGAPK